MIGDGQGREVIIAGDKLSNPDVLIKFGAELSIPSHLCQTKHLLEKKLEG